MINKKQFHILIVITIILFGFYFVFDFYKQYSTKIHTDVVTDTLDIVVRTNDAVHVLFYMTLDFSETPNAPSKLTSGITSGVFDSFMGTDIVWSDFEFDLYKRKQMRRYRENLYNTFALMSAEDVFKMKDELIAELDEYNDNGVVFSNVQIVMDDRVVKMLKERAELENKKN